MNIQILSDLHLRTFEWLPQKSDHDVTVLAGDISNASIAIDYAEYLSDKRGRPVIIVAGNHEFYRNDYDQALNLMRAKAENLKNIHFLEHSSVVIEGIRFIGCTLWTDFAVMDDIEKGMSVVGGRLNDYRYIYKGRDDNAASTVAERNEQTLGWLEFKLSDHLNNRYYNSKRLKTADTLEFHQLSVAWLERALAEPFDGKTVVVTHHAPHRKSIAPQYADDWTTPGFVSQLPESLFEIPALWIHGHTHVVFDYQVGNCRIVSNPKGYFGEYVPGFEPLKDFVVT